MLTMGKANLLSKQTSLFYTVTAFVFLSILSYVSYWSSEMPVSCVVAGIFALLSMFMAILSALHTGDTPVSICVNEILLLSTIIVTFLTEWQHPETAIVIAFAGGAISLYLLHRNIATGEFGIPRKQIAVTKI